MPVLAAMVAHTAASGGAILELGAGYYSTPLIHLAGAGRLRVTADSDPAWVATLGDLAGPQHTIVHVPDWDRFNVEKPWDVVFIDHWPYERRGIEARRVRRLARFVVLHDTEDPRRYGYGVLAEYRYRWDWKRYTPWTSVVSDFEDPRMILG